MNPNRAASPLAIDNPSSPWATRWPNGAWRAYSASLWIAFQSPLSEAKATTSASVTVRPALVIDWPTSNSSKYKPSRTANVCLSLIASLPLAGQPPPSPSPEADEPDGDQHYQHHAYDR